MLVPVGLRLGQIDARSFFSSRAALAALLPSDTTMLIVRDDDEGDGDVGEGSGVALEELKSFTTQAFFTCWRSLHLGLLQVGHQLPRREVRS